MKHIIVYSLPKITPKKRLQFNRELYGFTDFSNNGKYSYQRKGILEKKDYEKLGRATLLIKNKLKTVINHLKRYKAEYKIIKTT